MLTRQLTLLGLCSVLSFSATLSAQQVATSTASGASCGLDCLDGLGICSFYMSYIYSGSSYFGEVDEPFCQELEEGCNTLTRCGEDIQGLVDSVELAVAEKNVFRVHRLSQQSRPGAVVVVSDRVEIRDCQNRLVARFALSRPVSPVSTAALASQQPAREQGVARRRSADPDLRLRSAGVQVR